MGRASEAFRELLNKKSNSTISSSATSLVEKKLDSVERTSAQEKKSDSVGRAREAYEQLKLRKKDGVADSVSPYYFVVDAVGVLPPVRENDDHNSPIILHLGKDDVVKTFALTDDWLGVQIGSIKGWVLTRGTPRRQFLFPCNLCACKRAAPLGRRHCCRKCRQGKKQASSGPVTRRDIGNDAEHTDTCLGKMLLTEKIYHLRQERIEAEKPRRISDLSFSEGEDESNLDATCCSVMESHGESPFESVESRSSCQPDPLLSQCHRRTPTHAAPAAPSSWSSSGRVTGTHLTASMHTRSASDSTPPDRPSSLWDAMGGRDSILVDVGVMTEEAPSDVGENRSLGILRERSIDPAVPHGDRSAASQLGASAQCSTGRIVVDPPSCTRGDATALVPALGEPSNGGSVQARDSEAESEKLSQGVANEDLLDNTGSSEVGIGAQTVPGHEVKIDEATPRSQAGSTSRQCASVGESAYLSCGSEDILAEHDNIPRVPMGSSITPALAAPTHEDAVSDVSFNDGAESGEYSAVHGSTPVDCRNSGGDVMDHVSVEVGRTLMLRSQETADDEAPSGGKQGASPDLGRDLPNEPALFEVPLQRSRAGRAYLCGSSDQNHPEQAILPLTPICCAVDSQTTTVSPRESGSAVGNVATPLRVRSMPQAERQTSDGSSEGFSADGEPMLIQGKKTVSPVVGVDAVSTPYHTGEGRRLTASSEADSAALLECHRESIALSGASEQITATLPLRQECTLNSTAVPPIALEPMGVTLDAVADREPVIGCKAGAMSRDGHAEEMRANGREETSFANGQEQKSFDCIDSPLAKATCASSFCSKAPGPTGTNRLDSSETVCAMEGAALPPTAVGQTAGSGRDSVVFGAGREALSFRSIKKETLAMVVLVSETMVSADVAAQICTPFDFVLVPTKMQKNVGYGIIHFMSTENLKAAKEAQEGAMSFLSPTEAAVHRIADLFRKECVMMSAPAPPKENKARSKIEPGVLPLQDVRLPALVSLRGKVPTYVLPNSLAKCAGYLVGGRKVVTEIIGQFAKVDKVWLRQSDVKPYPH